MMEVAESSSAAIILEESRKRDMGGSDEEVMLPGFRFHPTDEELVGFYLRRKVEKKPITIEIIRQIDIYKHDPWDLPKVSSVGDKEWYFFCRRGRKYKNSIRPNRVTGSGFWKATGIDKPIVSLKQPHEIIGLKKSLVYYRGAAGKGTKTDWMMHEFRLPPCSGKPSGLSSISKDNDIALEAEVWTLCRIFKRVPSYKKYTPAMKERNSMDSSSKTCSSSLDSETRSEQCVSFDGLQVQNSNIKPYTGIQLTDARNQMRYWNNYYYSRSQLAANPFSPSTNYWSFWNQNYNVNGDDIIADENWDELRSVVELALN